MCSIRLHWEYTAAWSMAILTATTGAIALHITKARSGLHTRREREREHAISRRCLLQPSQIEVEKNVPSKSKAF